VRYGKPLDLSPFKGREKDRGAHNEVSDLIMERIRNLAPTEDTNSEPAGDRT
jgi:hypothetical protein